METPDYAYSTTLADTSFEDATDRVTEALGTEGFGILTEIDVKGTLKKKLDVDFRKYTILGACNPMLAHQALTNEDHIGLLLPCNVVVQEVDGGCEVSIANPQSMFSLVDNDRVQPVAEDADARLRRVIEALG